MVKQKFQGISLRPSRSPRQPGLLIALSWPEGGRKPSAVGVEFFAASVDFQAAGLGIRSLNKGATLLPKPLALPAAYSPFQRLHPLVDDRSASPDTERCSLPPASRCSLQRWCRLLEEGGSTRCSPPAGCASRSLPARAVESLVFYTMLLNPEP